MLELPNWRVMSSSSKSRFVLFQFSDLSILPYCWIQWVSLSRELNINSVPGKTLISFGRLIFVFFPDNEN